jgi:2-oxoglutarate dehydrogenase E1 component
MYQQWSTSHLSAGNSAYVEELFESYLTDPSSVSSEWRSYFEKFPKFENSSSEDVPHKNVQEHFLYLARNKNRVQPISASSLSSEHEKRQVNLLQLIAAYRVRGHQKAKLDPLGLMHREHVPDLELSHHGLSAGDLDTIFQTGSLFIGTNETSLEEIRNALEETYCASVGAEYMHIVNTDEKRWVQKRMEAVRSHPMLGPDAQMHLLERLTAAEGLEKFLGAKFPGTKRFGLEGGESFIPLIDEMLQRAGSYGIKECVVGMAHRGRLNLLVNILGKNPSDLFGEFEGKMFSEKGSGDVKYHQGFSSNVVTPGGEMHVAMAFNPSHLEIVSPVVEGSVRARQDRRKDPNGDLVLPIAIHGDAAFAGQGVVMETFQMSQTRGFKTGGTIHVIINNQVGFTTSIAIDARSTEYCTDVAKMVQAPIFHVNGDDPEAVYFATQLAVDYRMEFKKDVVIDLICYRRRGHNEADEPSITQPLMYQGIKSLPTTRSLYARKLTEEGLIDKNKDKEMIEEYRDNLEAGRHVAKGLVSEPDSKLFVDWEPYLGHEWTEEFDTRVPLKDLKRIARQLEDVPEGFVLQKQVQKIVEDRKKMSGGALPINWGYAEIMAYATVLDQNVSIRLTGQDVRRGTFSHRHALYLNQSDGIGYMPLTNLTNDDVQMEIYDSLLSEEAVLAFEYGYSTTKPDVLNIWEAQFGDFANGAQVVIDQFISSGEHKWQRLCGLTMLLPHGYEGQGPEHSSARLERYLQLCAENNIQVCIPSTPAQVFHLLRRQALRPLKKPLIAMTPKSLLRHKKAVSSLDELADGTFNTVLGDEGGADPKTIKRIILCSGKVYYDLLERKQQNELNHVAILRIEQLYPFPEKTLITELNKYKVSHIVWCQEEPMNQGAWYCSQHHMHNVIKLSDSKLVLKFAGRPASASPAVGSMSLHLAQQESLIDEAFDT